jgi:hypothetical protein
MTVPCCGGGRRTKHIGSQKRNLGRVSDCLCVNKIRLSSARWVLGSFAHVSIEDVTIDVVATPFACWLVLHHFF